MITSASLLCFLCKHVSASENSDFILCTECQQWFHGSCVNLCNDALKTVSESNSSWTCLSCKSNDNSIPNSDISQSDLIPCPQCADSSKLYKGVRGLRIHWAKAHSNENFIGNLSSSVTQTNILDAPAFSSRLASCKTNIQVLRRIPKGARSFSADKLSHLLDLCISTNTVENWQNLFLFAYIALRIPDQTSNKQGRSLVSKIKDNVSTFTLQSPQHHDRSPTFSKSRLVQAKVADGDVRGAIRVLSSESGIIYPSSTTYDALVDKHPSPSRPLHFPDPPAPDSPCLSVSDSMVLKAISHFPNGSASGIDGIRPQHLKDLTSKSAGDSGIRLLHSITRLCNFILAGKIIPEIWPHFFGASLIAINKKYGGIRPIAIGNTFRRLIAKLACSAFKEEMGLYLRPQQLGFGTANGCEAIIHTVRTFLHQHRASNNILLKIDFRNAFNVIERDSMLDIAQNKVPLLYAFLWQAYSQPTNLYHNSELILSQSGVQQGDPLGPLLFSLVLQPIISKLTSPLNLFYLDDGTLGGDPEIVLSDFIKLVDACKSVGLIINPDKCELYFCSSIDADTVSAFNTVAPGIRLMSQSDLSLLGSPTVFFFQL